jgi:hypothetical protein
VSPKGIRVVTVSPGFIETDAATRMIQRMAEKDNSGYAEAHQKLMEMLGGIPLGRPNTPQAVAETRRIRCVRPRIIHHGNGICHRWRDHSDSLKYHKENILALNENPTDRPFQAAFLTVLTAMNSTLVTAIRLDFRRR